MNGDRVSGPRKAGKWLTDVASSFRLKVTPCPNKDRADRLYKITISPKDDTEGISKILLPQMKLSVQGKTDLDSVQPAAPATDQLEQWLRPKEVSHRTRQHPLPHGKGSLPFDCHIYTTTCFHWILQKQVLLANKCELYCLLRCEPDALGLTVRVTLDGLNVSNSPFVITEKHHVSSSFKF